MKWIECGIEVSVAIRLAVNSGTFSTGWVAFSVDIDRGAMGGQPICGKRCLMLKIDRVVDKLLGIKRVEGKHEEPVSST